MSNPKRVRSLLRRTSHEIDEDVLAAIRTCDPATWPAIKRRARVTEDTLCESLFRLRVEKRLVAVRSDPKIAAGNFYEDGRVWYVLGE